MSRIGKRPIIVPEGVVVKINGHEVIITGVRGEIKQEFSPQMEIRISGNTLSITPKTPSRITQALWGTTRALLANMIEGVTNGFEKTLKLVGTGYRAKTDQGKLIMSLGYSHPVVFEPVKGIEIEAPDDETIKVKGIDKTLVGQVAAKIRAIRPPEPYKGKGIRYQDEQLKKKPGKAGKAGAAGFMAGGQIGAK